MKIDEDVFSGIMIAMVLIILIFGFTLMSRGASYSNSKAYCGHKPYDYKNPIMDFNAEGFGVQCDENGTIERCDMFITHYSTNCLDEDKFGFCKKGDSIEKVICV